MTTFAELIAARDLTLSDAADWTTPATDALPNGDAATEPAVGADAVYADTGNNFAIPWGTSDWTWEAWVRWKDAAPGSGQRIMQYQSAAAVGTYQWQLQQNGAATRNVTLIIDSGQVFSVSTGIMTPGVWHQVNFLVKSSLGLGAVAGRTLRSYLDGSLDDTFTIPSASWTPVTLTSPVVKLHDAGGDIEIAKIAIYHRELTGTEMTDHYDAMTT